MNGFRKRRQPADGWDLKGWTPEEKGLRCVVREAGLAPGIPGGSGLDELEERLETEYVLGFLPAMCVWYTCPDVCPPGG